MVAALLALGLGVLWHKQVRDHFVPRNFGVVQEGAVTRSGRLTPRATRLIAERHGIRTMVDLGAYDKHPQREEIARRTAEALGIRRYVFPLNGDATGNPNAYVAALRILADPANHPVHINCSAGSERTSACVMLYELAFNGRPFSETYPAMRDYKHDPEENPLLLAYLQEHGNAIIKAFREGGWVPGYEPVDMNPEVSNYAQAHAHGGQADRRSAPAPVPTP